MMNRLHAHKMNPTGVTVTGKTLKGEIQDYEIKANPSLSVKMLLEAWLWMKLCYKLYFCKLEPDFHFIF